MLRNNKSGEFCVVLLELPAVRHNVARTLRKKLKLRFVGETLIPLLAGPDNSGLQKIP